MRGGYPAPWSHGGPLFRTLREMNKINVSLETVVENRFRTSPGRGTAMRSRFME